MRPADRGRNRGGVLGLLALGLLFGSGAGASVWLTVRDARQRRLLAEIRTHLQRVPFSGRLELRGNFRGKPVELLFDVAHWGAGRTRVELVSPRDQPSRFGGRLGGSHPGRLWDELWDESLLLQHYLVQVEPAVRVLEREALRVTIRARRPHRPALVLVVDREQRFPLALSRLAPDGSRSFELTFRSIRFGPPAGSPPEEKPGTHPRWASRVELADALRDASPPLLPRRLPPDFVLQSVQRLGGGRRPRHGSRGERPAAWRLVYWDGLTRLVLYQWEKPRNWRRPKRVPTRKPSRTYKRVQRAGLTISLRESPHRSVARLRLGERSVILIGPLARDEILDCIASITPTPTH